MTSLRGPLAPTDGGKKNGVPVLPAITPAGSGITCQARFLPYGTTLSLRMASIIVAT
jgi:hypothetical protein